MENVNREKVISLLNNIMKYELAGVVRYTHSALMVTGPHRLPIVNFLQEQANESLQHAQQAGDRGRLLVNSRALKRLQLQADPIVLATATIL